jgi:hypothetical protein
MSPTGSHWLNFVYVNIGFFTITIIMAYIISVKEIKSNWGKYRCNPMFMMFSEDVAGDFEQCVSKVQEVSMGQMLEPTNAELNRLNSALATQSQETDALNTNFSDFNVSTGIGLGGISTMMENGSIEMQKMSYGLSDVMGKIAGIAGTLLYVLDGNMKTMSSVWKGPPGKVMRSLGKLGHCFHPTTLIQLESGAMVEMKNVVPGDRLRGGNRVRATMQIDNSGGNECLMKLGNVLVTGSHLVKYGNKFIPVSEHPDAKKQTNVTSLVYSCLITDNHKIQVGNYTFWDWEDYYYHQYV